MKITGELLKNERVTQGLSLQQVSQALKLNQKIIIALESGDESQLPAKTFIRGFVKSYAQFLKLDAEAVLRQFQEEMGSTSPLPKVPPPLPASPSQSIRAAKPVPRQTSQNYTQDKSVTSQAIREQDLAEKSFNNKILFFLFGAAALVLLIVAATRFIESESTELIADTTQNTETNVIAPNFNTVDPSALNSSDLVAANTSTDPSQPTGVNSVDPSNNNVSATASNNAPVANPTEAANPAAQTETPVTASSGRPVELVIEAKKDVEIFYAPGNSKNFKSLKLRAQSVQIIRSPVGLQIKSQDGGAFKVTANGIDQGTPGANNKPVNLTF